VRGCGRGSVKRRFDDGMAYERELFIGLMMTPECKALAPCLLRRARRQQDPRRARGHAAAQGRPLAVIGAGTMGGGITMNFLNAGIPVTMLEMKQDALDRGVATIRKNYEAQVKKGKLKQDKYDAAHGAAEHHAAATTTCRRRHGHRSRVRGDGRQGKGLQDAGRGDEARRHPGQQHQHAGREPPSPRSRSARRT
jgi:hypothetical protein